MPSLVATTSPRPLARTNNVQAVCGIAYAKGLWEYKDKGTKPGA